MTSGLGATSTSATPVSERALGPFEVLLRLVTYGPPAPAGQAST